MGAQIAQQAALHGIDVRLQDTSGEQLRKAVESNRGHLLRRVEKGRLSAEAADAAIGRVRTTTDLAEAAHDADLIIEAVFEDLGVKRSIFGELDRLAPGDAVLASNSSTMAITKIADATNRQDRCVNMHFFYPVLVMDLVEVVRGPKTSDQTVEKALAAARAMDRTPVLINKEIDGFTTSAAWTSRTRPAGTCSRAPATSATGPRRSSRPR